MGRKKLLMVVTMAAIMATLYIRKSGTTEIESAE
ncbi:hypothetical protein Hlac_3610 (plasmid) [Halorubrum lacusprofundi ATCC 49239]|jgi:hypothetical protein|uniref:Uncharacterized protein n=1 Tax=Halorubrum lacusprofundi (strain ATCC 49239 / DSM 5036 / JCM 8891 / ACAM 34) TaxID=416348 RepID=B9LXC5_HALLT|nr:hypothetical protein Hlac_3610 [Halorubrum lacusprofundi ATCC 49239]